MSPAFRMVRLRFRHTSCSLVLMENDPTARIDLERFMDDLVPEITLISSTPSRTDDMHCVKMA